MKFTTAKKVEGIQLPRGKKDYIEFDDDIPGLGLRIARAARAPGFFNIASAPNNGAWCSARLSRPPRKISCGCEVDPTVVVASPVDAIAPLASERDKPVIPNAGTALLRRLLFFEERFDMAQASRPFGAH